MSDPDEAIIELQTRVLFQEDLIQKLDAVIVQQGERLDYLIRRLNELEDKLEQLQFDRNEPMVPVDEKPPHY